MELFEIKDKLEKLDSDKLIEVVKNYRQYGYNDEIRNYALTVLEQRGITKADLLLTGNFDNAKYDYINHVFISFKRNSKLAFIFYGVLISVKFIFPHLLKGSSGSDTLLLVAFIFSFAAYFLFLLLSFLDQSKFYKLVGDDYGADGALVYIIVGMPFYVFMYFVFQSQMNEKLKSIG